MKKKKSFLPDKCEIQTNKQKKKVATPGDDELRIQTNTLWDWSPCETLTHAQSI